MNQFRVKVLTLFTLFLFVSNAHFALAENNPVPNDNVRDSVVVPNVEGKTFCEARKILADSKLSVEIVKEYYKSSPRGTVIWQSPSAGTIVKSGFTLKLQLSLGPKPSLSMKMVLIIVIFGLAVLGLSFRIAKQKNSTFNDKAARLTQKSWKAFGEVIPGNAQHIGSREEQQDAFGFSDLQDAQAIAANGALALLADGMGGLEKGREASNLAVRTALAEYSAKPVEEPIPHALQRVIVAANQAVYQMAGQQERIGSIGTTMIMAVIYQGQLYYASVGDSRIYLYRDGQLLQLTVDHVYANDLAQMVHNNQISREEAEDHPDRYALTSFLGLVSLPAIDQNLNPLSLQPGDKVVLCSDGLYNALSNEKMLQSLELDAPIAAEALIQKVLAEGYYPQDNMTVAILQYA